MKNIVSKNTFWLFCHQNPSDPKYRWHHPLISSILGTTLFLASILAVDRLFLEPSRRLYFIKPNLPLAFFFVAYLGAVVAIRLIEKGRVSLYDMLWACNLSMLQAAVGFSLGDIRIIHAALITVSVDQLLWYCDAVGYMMTKSFPIGVSKYLIWQGTSNLNRASSLHHLWFMPLVFCSIGAQVPSLQSFFLSCFDVFLLGLIGRFLTPLSIKLANNTEEYLNVNVAWEFWKDVKIESLSTYGKQGFVKAHFTLLGVWNGVNFLSYLSMSSVLYLITSIYS